MIVASGQIGHKSILDEFVRPTASNSLHQRVRFFNGKKQVLINSEWVDCNMCSPALPSHTPPHSIKDWYSYNHTATGVTGGSITGTTTVNTGTAYTYGVTLTGGTTSGTTAVWYKYENGAWSNALTTAPTVTITWVNPIGAKVKAVIINGCQGGTVEIEQNITYNCVNITAGSLQSVNTMEVNTIFTAYAIDSNGSPLGKTWTWAVYGNLTILAGQGTSSCVIKATGSGGINVVEVVIANTCNSYNPGQVSITISGTPPVYWNTQQSKSIQKNNCSGGQTGGFYTVVVYANTYSSTSDQADANQKAIDFLNSQYAQDVANNNALCYSGGTPPIPNEEQSIAFTKDDCSSGTPSVVVYTVAAGAFTSTVSQADANQKARDFIYTVPPGESKSRGQLNANANGICSTNPIYYSTERTDFFQRNNCGPGETGGFAWITSIAGQYTSTISVADANAIRDADMQVRANNNGATCSGSTVYWNTQVEAYFQKQCANGSPGSSHYYSIAANSYSSTVNQQAAQDAAIQALNQQGQAHANSVGTCSTGVNFGSVSVLALIQTVGSPSTTTIQLDNNFGSGASCRIRFRRYVSSTVFTLPWDGWHGFVAEGNAGLYSYGTPLDVGTPVEVQIEMASGQIETRTISVQGF
jgi:hypothetical protein